MPSIENAATSEPTIGEQVREPIFRSCSWKQWKNPRTRIANLKKLGIREQEAVTHGVSSKGPWVMSSSQAVHEALSVAFLSESGLVSLLEVWSKLAAKRRTA